MQSLKTSLLLLIGIAILAGCGLKGPLYISDEETVAEPAIEQDSKTDTDETDTGDDNGNNKRLNP